MSLCLVESLTTICQSINPLLSFPPAQTIKVSKKPTSHPALRLLWRLLHCWYILVICVCVPLQVSLSLSLSLSLPPSPLNTFTSLIYPSHHLCLRAPPSEVISAEKYGRWDERTEVAGKLNKQWLYYSFTLLQPLLFCCQSDQVNICLCLVGFAITIINILVQFIFMFMVKVVWSRKNVNIFVFFLANKTQFCYGHYDEGA